jgi:hypothetical protein
MDEMTRIEQTIRTERRNLDRNLTELEHEVRSMADWRTHYRNHPLAVIGVAAGAGVVVGMLTAGSTRASSERADSPRDSRERGGRAMSALAQLDPRGRASSRLGDTWDDILSALVGVASSAAIRFVSQHVSGFEEELASSQSMRSGSPRSGTRG